MTARRIAAALVAAVWAAPMALAGAAALHVAFDHHHGAGGAHDGLIEVAEHGHAHAGDAGEHEHLATPLTVATYRTAASVTPAPAAAVLARQDALAVEGNARLRGAPPHEPPRLAGPPFLALLSTLRV